MKRFINFYDAWHWLNKTIVFFDYGNYSHVPEPLEWFCSDEDPYLLDIGNGFLNSLCIEVVKVNPVTNSICMFKPLNISTRVWLECGEPFFDPDFVSTWTFGHKWDWDCGGATFEEAIVKLANLVYASVDTEEKLKVYKEHIHQMMQTYTAYVKEYRNGNPCR